MRHPKTVSGHSMVKRYTTADSLVRCCDATPTPKPPMSTLQNYRATPPRFGPFWPAGPRICPQLSEPSSSETSNELPTRRVVGKCSVTWFAARCTCHDDATWRHSVARNGRNQAGCRGRVAFLRFLWGEKAYLIHGRLHFRRADLY